MDIVEESIKQVHEQNFQRTIYERKLVGDLTNWRPLSPERHAKILSGYSKMLRFIARGLK